MRKIIFLAFLTVLSVQLFANDTLIFKIPNPRWAVNHIGGNFIRKVIYTTDSGFLALDYNETNLVARGYYSDTGFDIKIYTHYFYNAEKGFLQEVKCFDEMGSMKLHAELDKNADTIWRQTFKDDIVVNSKTFPEYEPERTIFFSMQKPAIYTGGSLAWKKYVAANMRYPKDAVKRKLEGTSVIEFTVLKDGRISNAKVLQSAGTSLLDAEAIRLVNASTNWIPAEENGNKVNFIQRRAIIFKL